MTVIRAQFTRGREVMYISHLDLMRTFARALRRSGIPIAYSQGFNPHPQMVFGLPLSVGVTSEAEYADFELENGMQAGEFMDRLNLSLPEGIRIIRAAEKLSGGNIMAEITRASYDIRVLTKLRMGINNIEKNIEAFMRLEEILVEKEGKKGKKSVDIRGLILEMSCPGAGDRPDGKAGEALSIAADLRAGSASNLRPELLIKAFTAFAGIEADYSLIHRTGLFVVRNGAYTEPLDKNVLV